MSDLLGGFFHSEYYRSSESVFITLTKENIGKEHICCAFSDKNGKDGLVTVVGTKKFHFMSDAKWLLRQGFVTCEELSSGFSLFYRGRFITTDISVCMESRFIKLVGV
ncbi:MAG: YoaP domain-containing protein [Dysgonamonadaceae bacterium]|jgi:hypothetical protein|nr:YoaP domain-containing protein [Dysgonamonadaceae bacterium]